MFTHHEERAKNLIAKAVAAGATDVKFTVGFSTMLRAGEEGLPELRYDQRMNGVGEEHVRQSLEAELDQSGIRAYIYEKGDLIVPSFTVYKTSDNSEVTRDFPKDDNKLYFVYFWATSSPKSLDGMQCNQTIAAQHPEWKGRVELITISLDDNAEAPQKMIEARGWGNLTSYWGGPAAGESAISRLFSTTQTPMCQIIHRGRVIFGNDPRKNSAKAITDFVPEEEVSREEFLAKCDQVRGLMSSFNSVEPFIN
jgi:hypothetical protein